MSVDLEQTQTLARLARLSLNDEQAAVFGQQLADILGYIDTLMSVDVSNVPEYTSAPQPGSSLRADEVGEMFTTEQALSSVPKKRGRLVVVPKFKETE